MDAYTWNQARKEQPALKFFGRRFHSQDLSRFHFNDCEFVQCRFTECTFDETLFSNSKFAGCYFERCMSAHSFWSDSHFHGSQIHRSSFLQDDFSGSHWMACDLATSHWLAPNWGLGDFRDCYWHYCWVSDANLKDTRFDQNTFQSTFIKYLNRQGWQFSRNHFSGCYTDESFANKALTMQRGQMKPWGIHRFPFDLNHGMSQASIPPQLVTRNGELP